MKAYRRLMKLKIANLKVWEIDGGVICVCYQNCEVKDGMFLIGEFGTGLTFEEACDNYMEKITGKTLVFNACGNRKEVTVL